MKKQNFFLIVALLFACNTIFAQTPGGYPVELKPWNPGTPPGIIEKPDTTKPIKPLSLIKEVTFLCYKNSSHLTLQCNNDEQANVIIYEMLSGVKHTSTINMVAGEIHTISTPWGTGLYTIRLTLSDGTILEGDFQIK
jgi:hypothetical protein